MAKTIANKIVRAVFIFLVLPFLTVDKIAGRGICRCGIPDVTSLARTTGPLIAELSFEQSLNRCDGLIGIAPFSAEMEFSSQGPHPK